MNYVQHMVASFRNHKQTCILCCYVLIFADLPNFKASHSLLDDLDLEVQLRKKGMSLELNRNATYRINPKRDRTQQDIDKSRGSWWDLIDKIHQIHSESGTLLSASFWNCYSFTLQRPHDLSGSIQI